MRNWIVTYCVDSAEDCDSLEDGIIAETQSLRLAVEAWDSRTSLCDGGHVEANEYPIHSARWFTKTFNEYDGDAYQVSLHVPESVTPSSRRRLARVLGVAA